MIGFAFSPEQLKSTPPEVRRWVEYEVAATVAAFGRPYGRHVWERMVSGPFATAAANPPGGIEQPHLGPYEDVATHMGQTG
jgi:hypothetical protein